MKEMMIFAILAICVLWIGSDAEKQGISEGYNQCLKDVKHQLGKDSVLVKVQLKTKGG